jgi:predicted Zn-dependent protease
MARLLPILLLLALLTGCGWGSDDPEPAVRDDERRVGAEQHPLLLAEFGGAYGGPEARYVAQLGERIAAAADLGDECTFTLINSDVVNAFAVPGCYIYVTRGLMGLVNSEAELAGVLAHEVGHIVAAHSRRQQRRSLFRQLGVAAVGFVTGSERLTRMAGEAAQYFTLRYSRRQEYEADDLGIRYLAAGGFDPHAAADMLAALGRQEQFLARTRGADEARGIPEWARTHPLTGNRVERASQGASAAGFGPDERPENEEGFLREVDGLLYGDDPAQGFVQGRRFAHPVMRIGFEAPPGFTLTNSPQAILIEGPDGLRGEFGAGPLPAGGLEAYASALLEQTLRGAPADLGRAQGAMINGVPAIVVPVSVRTEQGSAELFLAAYDGGGGTAFHFLIASAGGASGVDSLIRSFRLLSEAEARALRPRVIRTVSVGAGDTLQSLAARMASENQTEHFLTLNGRGAGDQLRPGELVKIISFGAS